MQLFIQGLAFFVIFSVVTYAAQVQNILGLASSTGVSSRREALSYSLLTATLATVLYLLFQHFSPFPS